MLFSMLGILIYAQDSSFLIEIDRDTSFDVRQLLKLPDNTYLYGEKLDNKQYGGGNETYFLNNQVNPNKKNGIIVSRDQQHQIKIEVNKPEPGDTATVNLVCAVQKTDGWYPSNDKKISISFVSNQMMEDKSNNTVVTDSAEDTDDFSETNPTENKDDLFKWLAVFNFICIVVIFIKLRSITKRNISPEQIKKLILAEIDERKENSQYTIGNARSQSSHIGLSKTEIEQLIDSKLVNFKSTINNLLQSRNSAIDASSKTKKRPKNDLIKNPEDSIKGTDTDDVIFDIEKSTFRLGQTDTKIFRIYSKGTEFYYTIPDNNNIRAEFVDMIPSFTNFVTIVDTNTSNANKVEPVKDGRLFKTGDEFMIDQNNKLELRFV